VETDLDLEELREYRSAQTAPGDFDEFWQRTLNESRSAATPTQIEWIDAGLATLDVADVTFSGYAGQPVRAWYRRPRSAESELPAVVQFVGYGGGRGLPTENLLWASAGYAHLLVDVRGQGSIWSVGETPDPVGSGPQSPGFMTRGVLSPETYYYRRVFADAVRAVDVVRTLPGVDPRRTAVVGASQGGGIALAVAGLVPDLTAVVAQVPFLCDFPRALRIHDTDPYAELVRYLSIHRSRAAQVTQTLRYFDGVNFARRATVTAHFTAALMDEVCKPSTVFGAFDAYAGPKRIHVHPFNGHEAGGSADEAAMTAWIREVSSSGPPEAVEVSVAATRRGTT
jgi:cephalosporin-C deacetylase